MVWLVAAVVVVVVLGALAWFVSGRAKPEGGARGRGRQSWTHEMNSQAIRSSGSRIGNGPG